MTFRNYSGFVLFASSEDAAVVFSDNLGTAWTISLDLKDLYAIVDFQFFLWVVSGAETEWDEIFIYLICGIFVFENDELLQDNDLMFMLVVEW